MLSIAAQSDVDICAVITYTIDGLSGSIKSKSFMYEAENLNIFKKKLTSYEMIQGRMKEAKSNEKTDDEKKKTVCYNCGEDSHLSSNCPAKDKGPKCFKCNGFGHKSPSCDKAPPKSNLIRRTTKRTDESEEEDN